MRRIWAIAHNTFREAIRDRIIYGMLAFGVLFTLSAMLLRRLTIDKPIRIVIDFGVFSVGLVGIAFAIVLGTLQLYKEIQKKTIYTILSKPIHRYEFILGKFIGMLLILFLVVISLSVVWMFMLWYSGYPPNVEFLKAVILIYMEVMLVASFALFFSSFTRPFLSAVFSTGLFLVGRISHIIDAFTRKGKSFLRGNEIAKAFVRIVPDLHTYNPAQELLKDIPLSWNFLRKTMQLFDIASLFYQLCRRCSER